MKALVLNGATNGDETLDAMNEIIVTHLEGLGWQVDSFTLRDVDVSSCLGCFGCWVRTPGLCVIDDAGRDIARLYVRSDLVVFLTPITFGGYSSELKKAIDRLIPNILPFFTKINGEVHHEPRYEHNPRLLAIGALPHPDTEREQLFRFLVNRNAINQHCPTHATGVVLTSQDPEAIRTEIQTLIRQVGANQ